MDAQQCGICERKASGIACKSIPPYFYFTCGIHPAPREAILAESSDLIYPTAVVLVENAALASRLYSTGQKIPKHVLDEQGRWSRDVWAVRLVLNPRGIMNFKDRIRLFRFLIAAGVTYPNEFVGDTESEELLTDMLKRRISLDVIEEAFASWPVGKDPFKVLQTIIKSHYGTVEKKWLLELMIPHYVTLALNQNQKKSLVIVKRAKDKTVKRLVLSYIQYLELLYVLKATEIASVTRRLPATLRRYMVESYFTLD
jgi:hypothetical protein